MFSANVCRAVDVDPAERALVAVAGRRDRAAFEYLFRRYAPRIKAVFLGSAPSAGMADEAVQETMLMVWRKAHLFDPSRGTVSAWIFAVARNVMVTNIRRTKRPAPDPNDPALVPDQQPIDAVVVNAEAGQRLRGLLRELPAEQADTLKEVYLRERTLQQVADAQGIPVGTVKTRVRLALTRLRNHFGVSTS